VKEFLTSLWKADLVYYSASCVQALLVFTTILLTFCLSKQQIVYPADTDLSSVF
jgi:hypothetical protein